METGLLSEIEASNVEVIRHDIRTDAFPPGSFDLIHARAVLMHITPSVDLLRRIVTWLAPGGWLLLEEPDFGMWIGDADPLWATSPQTTQLVFPNLALSQGRSLLRQIHQLGLIDVGADAEIDIIQAALISPSSTGSAWPPSPVRGCKLALSARLRRPHSSTGQATMTSWHADSSTSACGAGGPQSSDS